MLCLIRNSSLMVQALPTLLEAGTRSSSHPYLNFSIQYNSSPLLQLRRSFNWFFKPTTHLQNGISHSVSCSANLYDFRSIPNNYTKLSDFVATMCRGYHAFTSEETCRCFQRRVGSNFRMWGGVEMRCVAMGRCIWWKRVRRMLKGAIARGAGFNK